MNQNDEPYDWERFWIHFVCGALIGAGIGLSYWIRHWYVGYSGWVCIGLPALVVALLGGVFGDRFWEGLARFGRSGW